MTDTMRPPEGNDPGWTPKPLSDAPVTEQVLADGTTIRIDEQGRRLCHARRRDGELCKQAAVTGMKVCRMHGGSTDKAKQGAKLRLAELVNPAIATLAREMTQADRSVDKQRAANSILDRAGFGRAQKVELSDAKELLYQKLLAMQAETPDETTNTEETR